MARKKKVSFKHGQVILIALIGIALIFIAFQRLGFIGIYFDRFMNVLFGVRRDFVYFGVGAYSIYRIFNRKSFRFSLKYVVMGILSIFLVILTSTYISYDMNDIGYGVLNVWFEHVNFIFFDEFPSHGGFFGVVLYAFFTTLFDRLGTLFVLIIGYLGLIVMNFDFSWLKTKLKPIKMRRAKNEVNYIDEPQISTSRTVFLTPDEPKALVKAKIQEPEIKTKSAATVHQAGGNYTIPSLGLLDDVAVKSKSNANSVAASQKGRKLIEILGEFGVTASLVGTHIGPAVTKFEVRPESNVKISKIASLQDNIKMELSAKELRLEAPIPGRNAVGVEIPNIEMVPVRMIELMKDVPTDKLSKKLLFPLGKDLMGKSVFTELDKMPHLLIAGATGSGKSVCVNSIIINYLLRTKPDELKMVLIDPKKVEFTPYHNVPHLISPVISDATEAARALKVIVSMMENRYEIFSNIEIGRAHV